MNGLLLEEPPIQTAGEACSLDNYLVMPDDSMDARIAAAREKLAQTPSSSAIITSATK